MGEIEEREIAFIGKITAGVTHEMNNVLAGIKEISGLMEDILSFNSSDCSSVSEKFLQVIPRIQEQISRGTKLSTQLNKFSHLTYNREAKVEINEFIDHFVFLSQRFAGMKNVLLRYQSTNQKIIFITNPLQLQMSLYNCVTYLLKHSVKSGEIIIYPQENGEQLAFRVKLEGELADNNILFNDSTCAVELAILEKTMNSLQGRVEFDGLEQCITLIINKAGV